DARAGMGASSAISTIVPSSGRARRSVAASISAVLRWTQCCVVYFEQPLHALGHVPAGQRRAGDVPDAGVQFDLVGGRLADELLAPAGEADLTAVRLAVVEDLDGEDRAGVVERDRVRDQFALANDLIDQQPADRLRAGERLPRLRRPAGRRARHGE